MLLLCTGIFIWSFLEASFWWVAPDISIGIAYIYFPHYWQRFLLLALVGAFLGCTATWWWATLAPDTWLAYVTAMRFHSLKNIEYVRTTISSDPFSIVKGAWGGIPFKLFFGIAPAQRIAFSKIATLGLLSRSIRFSFVLGVTSLIRKYSKPWSLQHPTQLSLILLLIWGSAIALFDVVVNRFFL